MAKATRGAGTIELIQDWKSDCRYRLIDANLAKDLMCFKKGAEISDAACIQLKGTVGPIPWRALKRLKEIRWQNSYPLRRVKQQKRWLFA